MKLRSFFCLFLPFVLVSCAMRINGSIAADGSAVFSVNMSLEPRITALIRNMSAAGGQQAALILDGQAISQSMSASPGVSSVLLRNTSPTAIEGTVNILQIGEFLSAGQGKGFVSFQQINGGGLLQININRQNGPEILKYLSPEISAYLEALMSPIATGEQLSIAEYLDIVASVYNRPVSDEIASSRVRASIDFPGDITSVTGGTFSGRRAEFDITLVELLVLETPLKIEVSWR